MNVEALDLKAKKNNMELDFGEIESEKNNVNQDSLGLTIEDKSTKSAQPDLAKGLGAAKKRGMLKRSGTLQMKPVAAKKSVFSEEIKKLKKQDKAKRKKGKSN